MSTMTDRRAAVNRALDHGLARGAIRRWQVRRAVGGWVWEVLPASASAQPATLKGVREAECYAAGLAAALTAPSPAVALWADSPREHVLGVCTVDGRRLELRRADWPDGGHSFEVYDEISGECLTMDGAFDAYPTEEELRTLLR